MDGEHRGHHPHDHLVRMADHAHAHVDAAREHVRELTAELDRAAMAEVTRVDGVDTE